MVRRRTRCTNLRISQWARYTKIIHVPKCIDTDLYPYYSLLPDSARVSYYRVVSDDVCPYLHQLIFIRTYVPICIVHTELRCPYLLSYELSSQRSRWVIWRIRTIRTLQYSNKARPDNRRRCHHGRLPHISTNLLHLTPKLYIPLSP